MALTAEVESISRRGLSAACLLARHRSGSPTFPPPEQLEASPWPPPSRMPNIRRPPLLPPPPPSTARREEERARQRAAEEEELRRLQREQEALEEQVTISHDLHWISADRTKATPEERCAAAAAGLATAALSLPRGCPMSAELPPLSAPLHQSLPSSTEHGEREQSVPNMDRCCTRRRRRSSHQQRGPEAPADEGSAGRYRHRPRSWRGSRCAAGGLRRSGPRACALRCPALAAVGLASLCLFLSVVLRCGPRPRLSCPRRPLCCRCPEGACLEALQACGGDEDAAIDRLIAMDLMAL